MYGSSSASAELPASPSTHRWPGERGAGRERRGRRHAVSEAGPRTAGVAVFVVALAIGVSWPWALGAGAAGYAAWRLLSGRLRQATPSRLPGRPSQAETAQWSVGSTRGRVHELLDEARVTIARMRVSAAGIADTHISGAALSFCEGTQHFVDELQRRPRDIDQARRFLTYYLAAGRDIVAGYGKLEARKDVSPEIRTTLERVGPALRDMTGVLQKQLAGLLKGDAFDLDVELSLLHRTMGLDGLLDDPCESLASRSQPPH